jgi:hypothetical protein
MPGYPKLAGFLLWLALCSQSGSAQAKYRAPRTSDGQPDLQGIWMARSTAAFNLEDHGASLGMPAGRSVVVEPSDGRIPYLPEAQKRREENGNKRRSADPLGKCFLPGVPRFMYLPFPFQIFQTASFVVIAGEYVHTLRTIHFKGQHPEELELWMGDSRGRWDGDSLVINSASYNDQTWFDQAGNFHSSAVHVVERLTRTTPAAITYEVTIEDPKVFRQPWKIRVPLELQKNTRQLLEYECFVDLETEGAKDRK